jgi:hypothetical protein
MSKELESLHIGRFVHFDTLMKALGCKGGPWIGVIGNLGVRINLLLYIKKKKKKKIH